MCLHLLGRRGSYLRALFRGFKGPAEVSVSDVDGEFWNSLEIKTMGHKIVWLKQLEKLSKSS